jgi:competence protein ComEC
MSNPARAAPPSPLAHVARRLHGVPLLVAAAAGALLGDAVGGCALRLPPVLLVVGAAAAAVVAALGTPAWRRVAAGVLLCGWANAAAYRVCRPTFGAGHVARAPMRVPLHVEGVLGDDIVGDGEHARVRVLAQRLDDGTGWRPAAGQVLVSVQHARRAWQSGDRIAARLPLRRPRNFGNPAEFDYAGFLARRGVYVTAFAEDDSEFRLLGRVEGGAAAWLADWRRGVGALFRRTLPPTEASVLAALIIGADAALPRELRTAFSRAGVSHVLSISGLHVALVAAAGYGMFRWLLARSQWLLLAASVPKLAVGASVVPVLLYAGIAGSSVATVRAVIMILVCLVGALVDRQRHFIVSLAVAALLIILVSPGAALEISFQLSFVAVLGLVSAGERFWPWWRRCEAARLLRLRGWRGRLWRSLAAYAMISLSALAATTPLTAFHFNQVSLVAPVANALVVPLLGSVAVGLGLLAALFDLVWEPLGQVCVLLAWPALWLGLRLVHGCAALPFAAIHVVTPTLFELALMYALLATLVYGAGRARHWGVAVLVVLAVGDGTWWYVERYHRRDLRVTFLSVGQGDSAVVELPGAAVMVIDGGGLHSDRFDVGERIVAPFLWSRKIAHVDYLVLSHPDWDHYGGLGFVAEQFAPREFWWTGLPARSPRFPALLGGLADHGVAQVVLRRGDLRALGAVEAEVLWPPSALDRLKDNDQSLVLGLSFGSARVLFTGDLEAGGEASLVAAAGGRLASAVLKVPHHGSRTSSSAPFVDAVAPALAVVSAGYENRYRFPHPDVVRRDAAHHVTVLRTDLDGAAEVRIDPAGHTSVRRFHNAGSD